MAQWLWLLALPSLRNDNETNLQKLWTVCAKSSPLLLMCALIQEWQEVYIPDVIWTDIIWWHGWTLLCFVILGNGFKLQTELERANEAMMTFSHLSHWKAFVSNQLSSAQNWIILWWKRVFAWFSIFTTNYTFSTPLLNFFPKHFIMLPNWVPL